MSAPTGLCACGKPGCSDGSDQSVVTTPASDGTHMSGPQHYAEAERLLASVAGADVYPPDGGIARVHAATVAEAQVHATLALAAATAYTAARDWIRCLHGAPPDESDWYCAAPAPVPDDEAVANLMPHLIGYDCRLEIDRHAAAESILDAGYVSPEAHAAAVADARTQGWSEGHLENRKTIAMAIARVEAAEAAVRETERAHGERIAKAIETLASSFGGSPFWAAGHLLKAVDAR